MIAFNCMIDLECWHIVYRCLKRLSWFFKINRGHRCTLRSMQSNIRSIYYHFRRGKLRIPKQWTWWIWWANSVNICTNCLICLRPIFLFFCSVSPAIILHWSLKSFTLEMPLMSVAQMVNKYFYICTLWTKSGIPIEEKTHGTKSVNQ